MRISTQTLFESGGASISDLQAMLAKTQQQVATGKRILTPSDDPVAAANALVVIQAQSLNTQHARNRQTATDALTAEDSTLASVTNLIQTVQDAVAAAGNSTLNDSARAAMATSLQANLDQMVGLANTTDAQGNYVFSGYQSNTPAFVQSATGATYQGDSGQQLVQVDPTRQMAIGNTGQSVFQGGGQDVFQTIKSLVTLLQTPGAPSLASLTTLASNMSQSLNNVLAVRASVGSRLNELDALNSSGSNRDLQYSQTLSGLQDIDYAKAVTQLTQEQTNLQAAQQSFVKISGLSLFNYL